MSNFNIDENTVNKLKDMMNKGDLSNLISQIPPEMMQNLSSIMNSNNHDTSSSQVKESDSTSQQDDQNNTTSDNNVHNTQNENANNTFNFDFNQIDMNTVLKMKSIMEKMNNTNDPRSNLLYSLKPYLREERKQKLDQYANLMNFAKIAELLKNDNQESNNNG